MTGICLHFSPRILRLLSDYRLWSGDQPQGELALLLAGATRQRCGSTDWAFFEGATPEQLDALRALADKLRDDMRAAGCNQSDGAAAAQWRRRLRECAGRLSGALAPRARTIVVRQGLAPLFPQPPAQGPARKTYEQRVWDALVEFVDFTQSSAWEAQA